MVVAKSAKEIHGSLLIFICLCCIVLDVWLMVLTMNDAWEKVFLILTSCLVLALPLAALKSLSEIIGFWSS